MSRERREHKYRWFVTELAKASRENTSRGLCVIASKKPSKQSIREEWRRNHLRATSGPLPRLGPVFTLPDGDPVPHGSHE